MQVSNDTESVIDTDTAGRGIAGIDYRVLGIAHHYILYFAHRFSTSNKIGIAQKRKKPERGDVAEEEELKLWRQNLFGGHSAESLLNTLYFRNGKLFGLRANEHRLLPINNIVLVDNLITFDESLKTFHGGLKDLKEQARYIKHTCHERNEIHDSRLQSLYRLYVEKVRKIAVKFDAFYIWPNTYGSFGYESFDVFDCDISDDVLASIDLNVPSSLPSCPISLESTSSVMENVASHGTFNNCNFNFVINWK